MINNSIRIGLLFVGLVSCSGAQPTVRQPVVAGMFYPGDSTELADMIGSHLANVDDTLSIEGELLALIVPHAGLIYSGQIAAHAYKLLENTDVENLILCGPSHRFRFQGISIYGPDIIWKTPLGTLDCHDDLCEQLLVHSEQIRFLPQAHTQENSLEVQLPYIQTVLPECRIVPVIMGTQGGNDIDLLTGALKSLNFDHHTIMIASTDWQHFLPASEGWKMDSLGIECLKELDPDRLQRLLQSRDVKACGGGPVVAVLRAAVARGADRVRILKYGDSGDITDDKSSVVGYVAAAVFRSQVDSHSSTSETDLPSKDVEESLLDFHLSDADKTRLLEIARQSIDSYLSSGSVPDFEVADNLRQPGAAFVTLKHEGRLRGCIGHTVAQQPLYQTVSTCAIQAAVADPRFPPVKADELPGLHLEISVLTPLQKVEALEEIEVGRDGLMIFMGSRRGLLLPQVASEYGWNRTQFLEQTCRKAGLPGNAYLSPNTDIFKFMAIIFGEEVTGKTTGTVPTPQ